MWYWFWRLTHPGEQVSKWQIAFPIFRQPYAYRWHRDGSLEERPLTEEEWYEYRSITAW